MMVAESVVSEMMWGQRRDVIGIGLVLDLLGWFDTAQHLLQTSQERDSSIESWLGQRDEGQVIDEMVVQQSDYWRLSGDGFGYLARPLEEDSLW